LRGRFEASIAVAGKGQASSAEEDGCNRLEMVGHVDGLISGLTHTWGPSKVEGVAEKTVVTTSESLG
jgi:hypothetical protein